MKDSPIDTHSAPGPSRRERQRIETRDRIYRAALDEFGREGYAKAQIDHIVEKAGVARGTFYFHFPTKEHVLLELQRRIEQRIVEQLVDLSERASSVPEALVEMARVVAKTGEEFEDRALGRELLAIYVRETRVVDASADPLVVAMVDYFAEAAERGEVRTDIPPEEIAGMFLTTFFGFVASNFESLEDRLDVFTRMIDVFSKGIKP
jgi:TetR/AcrR family transcriptional repressor of uid operon